MLLILIVYLLFSYSYILIKESLFYMAPFFIVAVRMFVAGTLLLLYRMIGERKWVHIKLCDLGLFLGLSFFNVFLTNSIEVWALQYAYAAKTALIYTLGPFFAAILSHFYFKEALSTQKRLGLIIGFAGTLPVLLSHTDGQQWGFSVVDFALICGAMSSVLGWTMMKELVDNRGYNPLSVISVCMIFASILALFCSFFFEPWHPVPALSLKYGLLFTITTALVANVVCYSLFGLLLQKYSVVFMSFANFSSPLFASILAYICLGETVGWPFFVSLFTIIFGLYIFYRAELNPVKS